MAKIDQEPTLDNQHAAAKEKRRRTEFIHAISSPRYGQMALRALAIHCLNIELISEMTDEQLLALPGIGQTSLEGIRKHLRTYHANA